VATPHGAGGQSGLLVVPSQSPDTTAAFVRSSPVQIVAEARNITVNSNGVVTASWPGTLMYVAADSSNAVHVYGLDLSNTTTTPAAAQIGNLSVPLAANAALSTLICPDSSTLSAATNILDPTTLFVVLHIAGTSGCNGSGDTWEVVHYGDSATTAPVAVTSVTSNSVTPAYFKALYQPSGPLAGLVALDPGTSKLQLYADSTFASPTTLISNVTAIADLYNSNSLTNGTALAGTTLFFAPTTGSTQSVYRLTYAATTATQIYSAQGALSAHAVADNDNLYFTDTGTQTIGPSFGPITVAGTLSLSGNTLGTASGSGTSAQDVNAATLTVTETTTNNNETGFTTQGGIEKITATDVFTGTYSGGAFTATAGTYTYTNCVDLDPANAHCSSVTLNTPTSFKTVSTSAGGVSAAGGVIRITRTAMGVLTNQTYTFAAGSAGGTATLESVLQEPLTGGTPTQLLASAAITDYQLLGANGTAVVLYTSSGNASSLYTTPANAPAPASSATLLGDSPYTGTISTSFMQPASAGDNTTSLVFLTVVNSTVTPTTYASEVLSPDGTTKQPLTGNSAVLPFATSPLSGSVIQVRNMSSGGYDGGTFYNVNPSSLAGAPGGTALTTTAGAAYTVPAGTVPVLTSLSNSSGAGVLQPTGSGSVLGLATDLSKNLIVPIGTSLTNTNVALAQ
jgi:hypothetical protein